MRNFFDIICTEFSVPSLSVIFLLILISWFCEKKSRQSATCSTSTTSTGPSDTDSEMIYSIPWNVNSSLSSSCSPSPPITFSNFDLGRGSAATALTAAWLNAACSSSRHFCALVSSALSKTFGYLQQNVRVSAGSGTRKPLPWVTAAAAVSLPWPCESTVVSPRQPHGSAAGLDDCQCHWHLAPNQAGLTRRGGAGARSPAGQWHFAIQNPFQAESKPFWTNCTVRYCEVKERQYESPADFKRSELVICSEFY